MSVLRERVFLFLGSRILAHSSSPEDIGFLPLGLAASCNLAPDAAITSLTFLHRIGSECERHLAFSDRRSISIIVRFGVERSIRTDVQLMAKKPFESSGFRTTKISSSDPFAPAFSLVPRHDFSYPQI